MCLGKNDNILINQYIEMSQDLNPSTCSSLVVFKCWAMVMRKPQFPFNSNREIAATSSRFCNEPHLLHILFVKVAHGTTFTSLLKHHFIVIGKAEQQVRKTFRLRIRCDIFEIVNSTLRIRFDIANKI